MKKISYTNKLFSKWFIGLRVFMFSWALICISSFSYADNTKNKGKIIFSDSDVMLKEVSFETSKNNFKLLDDLYARVLLTEPLSYYFDKYNYDYDFNAKKYTYNYALTIKVDGKEYSKFLDETTEEGFKTVRTLAFPMATSETALKRNYSGLINYWVDIAGDIGNGKHTVEIELVPYTIELVGEKLPVLASGKFVLHVEAGDMEQFIAKNELDLPEPTMVNPRIEDKIVDASSSIIRRAKPVKAVITDVTQDWNYTYDENGNILYRHIVASVVYKLRDDKGCIVNSAIYTQKHQGYGNFGPMTFSKDAEGYYDYNIPCDVALQEEGEAKALGVR